MMEYALGVMSGFGVALVLARYMALRVASEILWRRPWVKSELTSAQHEAMTKTALAIQYVANCQRPVLPLKHWRTKP